MADFVDLADNAWRDFTIDGMPSSGRHKPIKSEVREIFVAIKEVTDAIEIGQSSGFIVLSTWTELAAYPTDDLITGSSAQVVDDAGTHTDPVVGGTVDNEGVYSYVEGDGWQRVADLGVAVLDGRLTTAEGEIDTLQTQMAATATRDQLYLYGQGPSIGFLTGMVTTPSRAVLDIEGHPIGVYDASNVSYALGSDGVWAPNSQEPDPAEQARTSASVSLPATRVPNGNSVINVPAQLVTSALPGSTAVTAEAITLKYGVAVKTVYQYPRTVVLTKTAGSVVLVENTDYSVDYQYGTITGLINTADIPCTVAYSGKKQRIDYVSVSRDTGALTVTAGTEVARIPSMWEPTLPAGQILVWRVLRWVDGAKASPAYRFRAHVRRGLEADYDRRVQINRSRIPRTRQKLEQGLDIELVCTGDSTTAMGASEAAQNTTPNGHYRDVIGYFADYDTATRALIPQYDLGDGAGATHTREGWGWGTVKAIEARYGVTVDYRNWGINGTDSSNGSYVNNGVTLYHGSAPTRLNPTVADAADIAIVAFGQNELGSTSTYANLLVIGQAFLDADTEVIFLTPSRRSPLAAGEAYTSWRYTCDAIAAAAETLGVACVMSGDVLDVPNLGAAPISSRELSEGQLPNHPGKREFDAVAALIADLF